MVGQVMQGEEKMWGIRGGRRVTNVGGGPTEGKESEEEKMRARRWQVAGKRSIRQGGGDEEGPHMEL